MTFISENHNVLKTDERVRVPVERREALLDEFNLHRVRKNNGDSLSGGERWVTLRVEGRRSNRSAIGTRIRVQVRTPSGPRDITATVSSGGSFGGGSLQREIGLGQAGAIELIEVRWPTTGAVQQFKDVPMDRFYRVVEGDERITELTLPRIPL
jgi:hypothetical protein